MTRARAVEIRGAGGVETLALTDIEIRDPGPGEVLVEVAACGLNRADIMQRRGFYPAPPGAPQNISGLEYAGTIAEAGPGVTHPAIGDQVMGIVGGGAMATHLVVHERELIRVPEGMPLEHAAAIPEAFLTAFDAVHLQGAMAIGCNVLIHSVGSGVGTAALQMVAASGGVAIGTSRTQAKLEACMELGLHHGISTREGKFADRVAALTGGAGADIILDTVGAAYLEENISALAMRGTMIVIGLLGGASGKIGLFALMRKRARIAGSTLRARPLEEKAVLAQQFSQRVVPLFASGALKPVIDDVMPMADIAQAHQRMEKNQNFGKIIMAW